MTNEFNNLASTSLSEGQYPMKEEVCIAVDSACDLPLSYLQKHNIKILPISVLVGASTFVDVRDPDSTTELYRRKLLEKSMDAETQPFSVKQMSSLLEDELIYDYDEVLVFTINSARSLIYKNVRDAVFISNPKFKKLRENAGKDRFFKINVMDTRTLFTGQGVILHEAVRLLHENGLDSRKVLAQMNSLKDKVRAYVVPRDLYYLKNRASAKGDKSIDWLSYQLGSMLNVKPIIEAYHGDTAPVDKAMGYDKALSKLFDRTRDAVNKGLSANVVVMSYAGDLDDIRGSDDFMAFEDFLSGRAIPYYLSVMSTTAAVNVGPGSFSLAYAE
jgi:DegV family protein with EDD domain